MYYVNGSDALVNDYGTPVCRAMLGWEKRSESETQVTYGLYVYIYCLRYGYTTSGVLSAALSCSGQTSRSVSGKGCDLDGEGDSELLLGRFDYTFNKSNTQQTPSINFSVTSTGYSVHGTSTGVFKPTIPALKSYAVTYDANGGTGSLEPGTKYYGQDLTLASGGLTRPHHTLKGWNTQADGSGTHYDLSGTYTANEAVTLYAEWELDAIVAKIKVNGSWQEGIIYTKVNGEWVIPYAGYVKVNGEWKEIEV